MFGNNSLHQLAFPMIHTVAQITEKVICNPYLSTFVVLVISPQKSCFLNMPSADNDNEAKNNLTTFHSVHP